MSKVKCAVYVRKSTEYGLDQEFNSLNNQEEACRAYIAAQAFNGWEYARTYTDGGISGGTMERPALKQMMDDMAHGLIQTVVVYKVDRLSRSIMDFHNMMGFFDKYTCNFVSITQSFDTSTSMGKLTLNMLLSFAQFEREVSSERVRDKIRATRAKGIWTGGVPWLGYDTVDKKLVINKPEAAQVRTIFEMYLEIGSVVELAKWLRDNGIFNKRWMTAGGIERGGNQICPMTLHRILREKIYTGQIEHKKNGTVADGEHDAIISHELFDAVQNKLADATSGKVGNGNGSPNLLSGKVYNANGVRFINQRTTKRKVNHNYYANRGFYLPAGDIDKVAIETVHEFLDSDLGALPPATAHTIKQIDWDNTDYLSRRKLCQAFISKVIYTDNKLTFYIDPSPDNLTEFITPNFINQTTNPMKFIKSGDSIIIEHEVIINKGLGTNKYTPGKAGLMTTTDNNHLIAQAFTQAYRIKNLYEECGDADKIIARDKMSPTTFYRYLNLAYLSPRIINALMSGKLNMPLRVIYDLASKYQDFAEQERLFFNG